MNRISALIVVVTLIVLAAIPCAAPAQDKEKKQQDRQSRQKEGREGEQARQQPAGETALEESGGGETLMDLLRRRIIGSGLIPIDLIGQTQETDGETVTIKGNAQVNYKELSVMADTIVFDRGTKTLSAEGSVVFIQPDLRVGGDAMEFNFNSRKGTITNPYLETKDGYRLSGAKLEKYDADMFRIEKARMTSCAQPTPNWSLSAGKIDFQTEKAATMTNALFRLWKIPLLYTPWMRFPMNKERSSGLLFPLWGNSDFHGRFFNLSYFWAFNRSNDATLGLDYYENRGWRYSGEYRANLGGTDFIDADYFFIKDKSFGDVDRYSGHVSGRYTLPGGVIASTSYEFLSDMVYRRDFINRNWYTPIYRQYITAAKNFGPYSLSGGYSNYARFRTTFTSIETRYLPNIDFRAMDQQIPKTPIYFNFKTNFVRPEIITRTRVKDASDLTKVKDYSRLYLEGQVKAPIKSIGPWITLTPIFTVRDTEYSASLGKKDNIKDVPLRVYFYDFEFAGVGPIFSRIFGSRDKFGTIYKHVVEPRLTYRWRSDVERQDKIVIVDNLDLFYRVHELEWSLTNRFFYKTSSEKDPQGSIQEFLTVGLRQYVTLDDTLQTSYNQQYFFDPQDVATSGRYSPLIIDASVHLSRYLSTSARVEYSFNINQFINYTISTNFRWRNIAYRLGWYNTTYIRFMGGSFLRSSANRMVTGGSADIFDGFLNFRADFDYDFRIKRIRNFVAGVDLRGQCMGLQFEIRKLNLYGQDDLQFRYGITLGGLRSLLMPESEN